MRPVLFEVFGMPVQSYGVSKALAGLAAAWLLSRAFARRGIPREEAYALTTSAFLWGFVGAKAYYLAENLGSLSPHDFGGTGFTWYGGFLAGGAAAVVHVRRRGLPLLTVAALAAAPLSVAYGIGRLGCLVSGDGTYGKPSDLPWAMTFPEGVVATSVPVHPTPLYEALAAFAIAGGLWWLQKKGNPFVTVAGYLVATGVARILVELLRTNDPVVLGLTQPQLWSLALVVAGAGVLLAARNRETPSMAVTEPQPKAPELV